MFLDLDVEWDDARIKALEAKLILMSADNKLSIEEVVNSLL